jgi:hypothetical protein
MVSSSRAANRTPTPYNYSATKQESARSLGGLKQFLPLPGCASQAVSPTSGMCAGPQGCRRCQVIERMVQLPENLPTFGGAR